MTDFVVPKYDLSDFFFTSSEKPLAPGEDYVNWLGEAAPALSLFEPVMSTGPSVRAKLRLEGGERNEINLASYNYLGLAQHPKVVEAAIEALKEFGTGACGSPLLSGMTSVLDDLRKNMCRYLRRDDALIYNSGSGGAIGSLSAMLRKGDVAILDQHAHICLIEGAKLAGARLEFFNHNDPEDLNVKLEKHAGKRRLVIVEGLYSMHGDYGKLDELVPVARQHDVDVMVDEAHSILAVGDNGRGAAELFGVEDDVALTYGTFSKSFANAGSVVVGSQDSIDYMRYYANSYGFSVALPPSVAAGVGAALKVATEQPELRSMLKENGDYFRNGVQSLKISTGESNSHVVPVVVGGDRRVLYEGTRLLRERGVFAAPVDYPSVPQGELRLRACVSSLHTKEDLDEALNIIEDTLLPLIKASGATVDAA